jgi:FkbM family methyltransferase
MIRKINNLLKTASILTGKSIVNFYKLKYFTGKNSGNHFLKLRNGLTLTVNKNEGDLTTLFEVFIRQDYKYNGTGGKLAILDIGGNIGYFALYISNLFPSAKIYSFEPGLQSYQRLQDNLRRNKAWNVKTFPYAVTDREGTVEYYSVEWAGCNTLYKSRLDEGKYTTTKVPCVGIDNIFDLTGLRQFDLAKIDCEGSEYPIILNSSDDSLKAIKKFIIEVHYVDGFHQDQLVQRFRDLGYTISYRETLLIADQVEKAS